MTISRSSSRKVRALAAIVDLENIQPDENKIDLKQWREDWDDEDLNDDFSKQLKEELGKAK